MAKFTEFPFIPELQKAIEEAGYSECTPVQAATYANMDKDLCVQSQTGSGKTAAYVCAGLHLLKSPESTIKRMLILVPTRELAVQACQEAAKLSKYMDIKTMSVFGGMDYAKQRNELKNDPDIVVGTPGRLIDFFKQKSIKLDEFNLVVLDEADRMLDMGFIKDIRYILSALPAKENRKTFLFSATMQARVRQLAWGLMNEMYEIDINPENITVDEINQELYHVPRNEKFRLLLSLIRKENPSHLLIFTNTKEEAERVAKKLTYNGHKAVHLIGDLSQQKRLGILAGMKAKEIDFVVATDVAARGLDVKDLPMVINYDIPEDYENYVHRIGRTARAGTTGKAITLACEKYVYGLEAIEKYIKMKIPVREYDYENLPADDSPEHMVLETRRHSGGFRSDRGGRKPASRGPGHKPASSGRHPETSHVYSAHKTERPAAPKQPQTARPVGRPGTARPAQGKPNPVQQGQSPRRSPDHRQTAKRPPIAASAPKSGSRVDYYNKKYGDSFAHAEKKPVPQATPKKQSFLSGLVDKIKGVFSKPSKKKRKKRPVQ
jgi:ATP-dependent RNA helicase RhlB